MANFKISRFPSSTANRELCTTKSDRLGEKQVWDLVKTVLAAAKTILAAAKTVLAATKAVLAAAKTDLAAANIAWSGQKR